MAKKLTKKSSKTMAADPDPGITAVSNAYAISIAGGRAGRSAYAAAGSSQRRRVNLINLRSEDDLLKPRDRDKLISEARILRRNAPDVGWMIRKHLDYVSTFEFQCRTGNKELDTRIEELMTWWGRPLNCDVTGRHSLKKLIRLAESMATTDGDCFVMKLSDGKLQLIEGDRVRTPTDLGDFTGNFEPDAFHHGVEATAAGKPLRYAICERRENNFVLKSVVPAQYMLQHGYFERYDQIRGVSPLASAINTFCDLYEARDYALAKAKLAQLFAVKLKLSGEPEDVEDGTPQTFDFGAGPQTINLGADDEAEFMESGTPSTEFQDFLVQGTQIGLKALDIPYSFFSENFTNYSGARQALLQYDQSCEEKRARVALLLNALTVWRLSLFIEDGHLELPSGYTLDDVAFEWIPAAIPWIDPQREANANALLITNKLASRQQIMKEQGRDWFTTMDQLAAEDAYLREKGLSVATTEAPAAAAAAAAPDQGQLAEQVAELVAEAMRTKGN